MLNIDELKSVFAVYRNEMDRCERAKTYWALLHIVVCLPDTCSALQSEDGRAKPNLYKAWCGLYLQDDMLAPDERWDMRCTVLHQGRTQRDPNKPGRYGSFAFGQPGADGTVDHMRVDGPTLHLDVGCMAREMKQAIENWCDQLEASPKDPDAINVAKNLPSVVRVVVAPLPSRANPGNFVLINKTN